MMHVNNIHMGFDFGWSGHMRAKMKKLLPIWEWKWADYNFLDRIYKRYKYYVKSGIHKAIQPMNTGTWLSFKPDTWYLNVKLRNDLKAPQRVVSAWLSNLYNLYAEGKIDRTTFDPSVPTILDKVVDTGKDAVNVSKFVLPAVLIVGGIYLANNLMSNVNKGRRLIYGH